MNATKFSVSPNLVIRKFDSKVLNKNTGFLFELNKEGILILEKLGTPQTILELCEELSKEFKIKEPEKISMQKSIEKFCNYAVDEKLLVKM